LTDNFKHPLLKTILCGSLALNLDAFRLSTFVFGAVLFLTAFKADFSGLTFSLATSGFLTGTDLLRNLETAGFSGCQGTRSSGI
jgi:hypothetical protein